MSTSLATQEPFARLIADRMQARSRELSARWLERLHDLLPLAPNEIFASETLLDHIPTLIEEIGRFVGAPGTDIITNTFVIEKGRELGLLRHAQRSSVHQLLREYDLLRGILENFVVTEMDAYAPQAPCGPVVVCLRRINAAVAILTQITVDTFVEEYADTIGEQARRLEAFSRMISHELRQPLGAIQAAAALLRAADADPQTRERRVSTLERNAAHLGELLGRIARISQLGPTGEDGLTVQRLSLSAAAAEAARRLRDAAAERAVTIDVAGNLPDVVVDASRLDLIFTNLLSNAIKYSDPRKSDRVASVSLRGTSDMDCVIEFRDNGIGMTPDQVRRAFLPFYRGHAGRDHELRTEGSGLGLAIVRECVRAIGGTILLEAAPNEGSVFTLTVPLRPLR